MGNLAPRSDARQGSTLQPSSNEGLELNPLWDIGGANPTSHGTFQDGGYHTTVHKKTQNEPCGLNLEPLFHSLALLSTKLVRSKQIGKPISGVHLNNVSIAFTRANRAAIAASRQILAPTRYAALAMNLFYPQKILVVVLKRSLHLNFYSCLTVLRWNSASKWPVIAFPHGPIWGTAARKSPTSGTPPSLKIAKAAIRYM